MSRGIMMMLMILMGISMKIMKMMKVMKMIIKMGLAGHHLSNDPPPLPDMTCYSLCTFDNKMQSAEILKYIHCNVGN